MVNVVTTISGAGHHGSPSQCRYKAAPLAAKCDNLSRYSNAAPLVVIVVTTLSGAGHHGSPNQCRYKAAPLAVNMVT